MMPLTLPLFYHFFRWMEHTGDTLATVMGWLSSTQAGGATTFHNGVDLVRLWPTRGAAGVWYSLYTDGSNVGWLFFRDKILSDKKISVLPFLPLLRASGLALRTILSQFTKPIQMLL